MNTSCLSKLAEYSLLKNFAKKDMIFCHGDKIEYFYIISSGWIKLFRDTLDGQEALLGLASAKDIVGEIDFDKNIHSFSAQAINETELLLIPYKILEENIKNDAKFALRIIKAMNTSISLLELQLEHASTMNAAQKVGCFFLRLTDLQNTSFDIVLPCDKSLIASYLCMKGETFSRALNELKPLGVTIKGNLLSVADINKLIKFCCVSCSLVFDSCKN